MTLYYQGARIFHDGVMLHDHSLLVDGGKTVSIIADSELPVGAPVRRLDGGILSPGFIETQANGGGGYLVNAHCDAEGLAHILAVPRGRDITLHSGKQKLTIRANEREHYLTPRGHKGNWLPKNYRRIDHIELPAENPTPS